MTENRDAARSRPRDRVSKGDFGCFADELSHMIEPGPAKARSRESDGLDRVFTEYVRSLEPGNDFDPETFARMWEALRRRLRGELKRRGLWQAPPAYLDIIGAQHWWEDDESAFNELLHDCFEYIFCDRLRPIRTKLRVLENIDGLIVLNVRHFLSDRQQGHDPVGARVFRVLRKALLRLVETGDLQVLDGDAKISSGTYFGFSAHSDYCETRTTALEELVTVWCDDLLPELVNAIGRAGASVLAQLEEHLLCLSSQGFEAFLFHDVLDPLRQEVRRRWAAVWNRPDGEIAADGDDGELQKTVVIAISDRHSFIERENFRELTKCVSRKIERAGKTEKTRRHLLTFWHFLVDCCRSDSNASVPPYRKLGPLLGIGREAFPKLRRILGQLIHECTRQSGKLGVSHG